MVNYDKLTNAIETAIAEFEAVEKKIEYTLIAGENVNSNTHIADLASNFVTIRKHADRAKELREKMYRVEDRFSRELIPDAMRAANIKTANVDGVGRLSLAARYSCSMIDKDKGMEWLRANGEEGLISEVVNSSTLGAFAKNLLIEEGTELPSEIFKTSVTTYTSVTASKK